MSDDGSTDGTVDAIHAAATTSPGSPKVRIVGIERVGGVVSNFERAVRACTGDLIALSDHDDVWTTNRLSRAVAKIDDPSSPVLVFSDARLIDGQGRPTGQTLFASLRLSRRERSAIAAGHAFAVLLRRNVVTGATAILSRPLVDLALPFPPSWVHDEWLAIVASVFGRLVLVDEPLIDYRIHGGNQIGVASPTAGARLNRMFGQRGDRLERLHKKYGDLLERLDNRSVPNETLLLLRGKVAFERARAAYPSRRLRRLVPVVREWMHGRYGRYASQGNLDVVRDLLQPA